MNKCELLPMGVGCDEAAFQLKDNIRAYLEKQGHTVEDYGVYNTVPSPYPNIALEVSSAVAEGKHQRGILMCRMGIGMAITANKVPGIRAAVCHDVYSAERARKSNAYQVMALEEGWWGRNMPKASWMHGASRISREANSRPKLSERDRGAI
jgi:ribose 5-phosphate isomerase B